MKSSIYRFIDIYLTTYSIGNLRGLKNIVKTILLKNKHSISIKSINIRVHQNLRFDNQSLFIINAIMPNPSHTGSYKNTMSWRTCCLRRKSFVRRRSWCFSRICMRAMCALSCWSNDSQYAMKNVREIYYNVHVAINVHVANFGFHILLCLITGSTITATRHVYLRQ